MLVADATTTAVGASSSTTTAQWVGVLLLIALVVGVAFYLLVRFYKGVQSSSFISDVLGLPARGRSASRSAYQFAEEVLARRTEFWLLYAQFVTAVVFIAVIAGLMLVNAVDTQAGLPALSTVVGLVLGKTLLSAKGSPATAQEQSVRGPANTAEPSVTAPEDGITPGSQLTADPGEWSGQLPIQFSYAWKRLGSGGIQAIDGEQGSTYAVRADDQGSSVAVVVTASNPTGTATAESSPLAVPAADAGA